MLCVRAWAFRVNKFSLIYRCSLLYIHCCLLNIMRLTPDPVLIFVTLSLPLFLTLSRTSDAMQLSLLVCLSLCKVVYMSQQGCKPTIARSRSTELDKTCGSNLSIWFVWWEWSVQWAHPLCCCCCLLGFNFAFNNFSVISRQCLVATGSSMLTFIVLRHWRIMPQTLDMIPYPVPLSWHCLDQS